MKSIFNLLLTLPAVFAAPSTLDTRQDDVDPADLIPNSWIVQLRGDADQNILQSTISQVVGILGAEVKYTYDFGSFKGFSMNGVGNVVNLLSNIASIESIEQDSIVRASALTRQRNAEYGLARISHREKGADDYIYDDSAGEGTFSYIIDTGIYAEHNDFGGRATFAANFAGDGMDTDGNGHGTHVSGTTGSTTYGVAKKTQLIGVKVLDADGAGALSGVIKGIEFATNDAKRKGRIGKAVGNLSLGGIPSLMTNLAVREAVSQGLFLAVAAGNSGLPTITASPASEPSVCTVGAIDEDDARASFSNFGLLVDVFAPGVNVTSTWIDGPDDTNTISGTSMASPHVCGLGAYLLGLEGEMGARELCTRIKDLSTRGKVGLPLSVNRLAFNGASA